jgi:hypothetical protein
MRTDQSRLRLAVLVVIFSCLPACSDGDRFGDSRSVGPVAALRFDTLKYDGLSFDSEVGLEIVNGIGGQPSADPLKSPILIFPNGAKLKVSDITLRKVRELFPDLSSIGDEYSGLVDTGHTCDLSFRFGRFEYFYIDKDSRVRVSMDGNNATVGIGASFKEVQKIFGTPLEVRHH